LKNYPSKGSIAQMLTNHIGKAYEGSTSPFHRWLNPIILSVEKGSVELEYPLRPEMLNPMDTLHGGITAAIVDDAIGVALFSLDKANFHSTINNTIDYLAPVLKNDAMIVKARIIKNGRNIVNGECVIYSKQTGKLVAKGTSNLLDVGLPIPRIEQNG
jgi:acyl-coenzyme A thioesterase 13